VYVLWVGFHKKTTGDASMTWEESVDQALCFGWIDGLRKSIDDKSYMIRFTPRRPDSMWSAVNIRRVRELKKLGLMKPAGLRAFTNRDPEKSERYSFEQMNVAFAAAQTRKFRANKKAWAFFQSEPPSYRKLSTWWVISAKREDTKLKRLNILIADSAKGLRIGPLRRTDPET